jgi:hypothetical protein
MSLIKLFLGGNNLLFSRPERVWSVTSRLGKGKWLTLFYSVQYTVKKGSRVIIPAQEEFGSDIPAGDGKLPNLFLRCILYT